MREIPHAQSEPEQHNACRQDSQQTVEIKRHMPRGRRGRVAMPLVGHLHLVKAIRMHEAYHSRHGEKTCEQCRQYFPDCCGWPRQHTVLTLGNGYTLYYATQIPLRNVDASWACVKDRVLMGSPDVENTTERRGCGHTSSISSWVCGSSRVRPRSATAVRRWPGATSSAAHSSSSWRCYPMRGGAARGRSRRTAPSASGCSLRRSSSGRPRRWNSGSRARHAFS